MKTILIITLLLVASIFCEITYKHYGLIQYRLRMRMQSYDSDNIDSTETSYHNQIGYFIGTNISVNKNLSLQFQIGNNAWATESINWSINNHFGDKDNDALPYFHLANAKWDPGYMFIVAGIQPIKDHGALDLLYTSKLRNSYEKTAYLPWFPATNNTLTGLKLGKENFLKGQTKIGINLLTSVTEPRTQTLNEGKISTANMSGMLFIGELPFTINKLVITPQTGIIVNRNYYSDQEKGNIEQSIGLSALYKLPIGIVNASFGVSSFDNKNSSAASDTVYQGMIVNVYTILNAGPGKVMIDFRFSTNEDTELVDSKSSSNYLDLRYFWAVNKKFTIQPRFRIFSTSYEQNNKSSHMELRPELIFCGQF